MVLKYTFLISPYRFKIISPYSHCPCHDQNHHQSLLIPMPFVRIPSQFCYCTEPAHTCLHCPLTTLIQKSKGSAEYNPFFLDKYDILIIYWLLWLIFHVINCSLNCRYNLNNTDVGYHPHRAMGGGKIEVKMVILKPFFRRPTVKVRSLIEMGLCSMCVFESLHQIIQLV